MHLSPGTPVLCPWVGWPDSPPCHLLQVEQTALMPSGELVMCWVMFCCFSFAVFACWKVSDWAKRVLLEDPTYALLKGGSCRHWVSHPQFLKMVAFSRGGLQKATGESLRSPRKAWDRGQTPICSWGSAHNPHDSGCCVIGRSFSQNGSHNEPLAVTVGQTYATC